MVFRPFRCTKVADSTKSEHSQCFYIDAFSLASMFNITKAADTTSDQSLRIGQTRRDV
jgi:hypothetical protein